MQKLIDEIAAMVEKSGIKDLQGVPARRLALIGCGSMMAFVRHFKKNGRSQYSEMMDGSRLDELLNELKMEIINAKSDEVTCNKCYFFDYDEGKQTGICTQRFKEQDANAFGCSDFKESRYLL